MDLADRDARALVDGAVTYIQKRFVVNDVLKHCDIFDPTNWPTTGDDRERVIQYGREEMLHILDHFEPLFDGDFRQKVEEQWLRLKLFVCKRIPLSERHFHTLWPRMVTQDLQFAKVMKIISIFMLLPMNTSICERGFSAMNRIKSDGRSVMLSSTLMFINYR